jgi:hypothetical protein
MLIAICILLSIIAVIAGLCFWMYKTPVKEDTQSLIVEGDQFMYKFQRSEFDKVWKSLSEGRRRLNAGIFVQVYNREPTREELKTGDIQK